MQEEEQMAWLVRKLAEAGARLGGCKIQARTMLYSERNPAKDANTQTHLGVLFEGMLEALDPDILAKNIEGGIGSAKGFGFGMLSIARAG